MRYLSTLLAITIAIHLSIQLIDARREALAAMDRVVELESSGLAFQIGSRHLQGERMQVEATAYLCVDEKERRFHGITKSGDLCEANWSAAVDPTIIPLGSMIYVPSIDRWFVAHDTGSMIKGKAIDLAVDGREEALFMGRRDIEIIVVRMNEN